MLNYSIPGVLNIRRTRAALGATVASMALLAASPVVAQTAGSGTPQAAKATEAEQIVVTGTRRTDRSAVNSASPVDIISSADILTQPTANVIDSLRNIIPSFFVGQNTISDASTFVRAPSLRGLSPDEIQVQLNGKRFNRSALVQVYNGGDTALSIGSQGADISSIPSIALGNLQVLRDGATAQYGSDAIAGVLNFGLRRDTGIELQARYGQFYDSGANGQSYKNANGRSYQIAGNVGFKLGSRGFVNLSGEYTNDGQTIRNVTRPIAVAFAAANPSLASQLPNFPGPVQIYGTSPSEAYKFVVNSELEVTDSSAFYFFGNYARSSANQSFNFRSPISAPTPFAVNDGSGTPATRSPGANGAFKPIYLTPCPATGTGCEAGGFVRDSNVFRFSSIYPAGFTPRFIGVTKQIFGAFGYKGKTEGGLTYDASISASRNSLALSMTNSLSASFGPQSQTSFQFGTLSQSEFNANLDLTYPIEVGFATPITLSGGFEFRRETYGSTEGDLQSYAAGPFAQQRLFVQTAPGVYVRDTVTPTASQSPGASGYGGTSPASAGKFTQSNFAFYAGAETDVTSALSVGIAGRFERYNTFGSAVVGKINAIYHISDAFALRGTVGSGFHAPSPGQSNVEILTTSFFQGDQVQTGTYPVNSAIARAFGAKPLGPERSLNFGLGFVWEPTSGLSFTVDGYSIAVRNRISITNTFSVTAADLIREPALAAVGEGGDIQYFTNGFATKTQGVDVVGNWKTNLLGWNSNYTLAYNYNKSTVTSFDPNAINAVRISDISNFAPKHRIVLTGNFSKDNWSINARTNYFSSWSTQNDYPGQVFRGKVTSDLDVSYTLADHYTLTVGGNNIFNTKPDRIAPTSNNPIYDVTGSTSDGQIYPRAGGPFGFNGGFWYVRVRVKY